MNLKSTTTLFGIYFFIFSILYIKSLSAGVLYYKKESLVSTSFGGLLSVQDDSQLFSNIRASFFAKKELHNSFDIRFYISGTYLSDRDNDPSYKVLQELYTGFNSDYGNLYIGRTPTVYYNDFPAGWLDYKIVNSKHDAIESCYYGDFFTTKVASNSIFYTYKFSNFKISLQGSSRYSKNLLLDDYKILIVRKYAFGVGLGYAYGPIQFGGSYINIKMNNLEDNNKYDTNLANMGAKIDLFGWYSAIGVFYDKNRIYFGNESYSFQYLIQYDEYYLFNKKLIPQISYSYKIYTLTNHFNKVYTTPNNDLYLSLSYFLNSNLEIFTEGKLDVRSKNQINKIYYTLNDTKYLKYNRISLGARASF